MTEYYESRWRRLLIFQLPLAVITVITLFPLAWMLSAALKEDRDLYNPRLNPYLPTPPTLEHFTFLFRQTQYLSWLLNSIRVTFVAVAFSLLASTLAGYALSRLRFPGASLIGWLMFITYLVPSSLLFLPLSRSIINCDLLNSR
ncbi:MAG: carbohydrate ABC transporter permease, partial [Rhodospirillales bacterium]|nr:carbohydrate ABC transporter permease [Rhodospirillales bacterium]